MRTPGHILTEERRIQDTPKKRDEGGPPDRGDPREAFDSLTIKQDTEPRKNMKR